MTGMHLTRQVATTIATAIAVMLPLFHAIDRSPTGDQLAWAASIAAAAGGLRFAHLVFRDARRCMSTNA